MEPKKQFTRTSLLVREAKVICLSQNGCPGLQCCPELVISVVPCETESDPLTPTSRENGNPGQDVGSKVENPSMYYSAVKKDKQSLRKKVVRYYDDEL